MNPREAGFLLLTSHLGDPNRKILTVPQLRELARRVNQRELPEDQRELTAQDLVALGYDRQMANRILGLLEGREQLRWYLEKGARADCCPISRVSSQYPAALYSRLRGETPGCLWAKGELSLLDQPAVSLVGSRDLEKQNRQFAREAGKQAALQGIVLISGNARGADREAQEACLAWGGSVISVVADSLEKQPRKKNVLYLSEDGFDLNFSSQRALSRNRVIHCLGALVLVAQCGNGRGGTWDGTCKNLNRGWSPVFCYHDGTPGMEKLLELGGKTVDIPELSCMSALDLSKHTLFDQ